MGFQCNPKVVLLGSKVWSGIPLLYPFVLPGLCADQGGGEEPHGDGVPDAEDVEKRKAVIRSLKAAYSLRSRFVRYGNTIDELETVRNFMLDTWLLFSNSRRPAAGLIQRSSSLTIWSR